MNKITPKERKIQSHYLLVYGKELVLPVNLEINALSMAHRVEETYQYTILQLRYHQLMQLEEQKEKEITTIQRIQVVKKKKL